MNITDLLMENGYKEGDVVYATVNPTVRLIIRRIDKEIFYCKTEANPTLKELVYFKRELMPE